jgi:putative endopeptidase
MSTYAGDDFYQYAVGKWLQNNPLKEMEMCNGTLWGMDVAMEAFIDSQALNSEDEVLKRLNSDFSASTKDADLALLKQKVADIYAISSVDEMYKKMGELMFDGYQTPFVFSCMPNERRVRPYLKLVSDRFDASSFHFEEYAGISETEAKLIVKVSERWKNECLQDAEDESRKMPHYLKELNVVEVTFPKTRAGGATSPLEAILTSMGFTSNDIKLLADKDYKKNDAFLSKLSLDDLKRFSVYMVVNRDLRFIPYESEWDYMNSFVCLTLGNNNPLAIRLSGIYNKKIPAANRAAAITMANELRETFKERMNKLPWMSADTRAKAIEKLDNMITMIGWPDDDSRREEWSVKAPSVPADGKATFYTDVLDLYKQKGKIIMSMLNNEKIEDLFYANEMEAASYTANALYSPNNNHFVIMSCNLVPPIFDPNRNDAINYAVLGASTIGHEITHGFDPNGKQFNKVGKLEEWMAPADSKAFDALTEKMIAHFNKQRYGNYGCDGYRTVGENTADLGGLYIGYDAFMKLLAKKGVTGDELDRQGREFFRAFAYGWMGNYNSGYIQLISTDFHAFEPVRVNGNVYLMDEFYRLFNIKSGKRYLAPADRIEIW